MTHHNKLKLH